MRIFISNDDGIHAPGIRALARAMAEIGEVTVVAPNQQRSASSHGITLHHLLYVEQVDLGIPNVTAYSMTGTPVDCVKWGICEFGTDVPFDWMVSGINEGPNLATDVLYSGTVAAAGEAALQRIPSIALSLLGPDFPYDRATRVAVELIHKCSNVQFDSDTFLSVNIPNEVAEDTPMKVCPLGARGYRNEFRKLKDQEGRTCYSHAGEELEELGGGDTDVELIRNGYITVTPLRYRFTNEAMIDTLAGEVEPH